MNLLPIWHTSSNNYQKFKILKKNTDLRINGELITKSDIFKDLNNSSTGGKHSIKTTVPEQLQQQQQQQQQDEQQTQQQQELIENEFEESITGDNNFNEFYAIKKQFFSTSTNAINITGIANNHNTQSSIISQPTASLSSENLQIPNIHTSFKKSFHIKTRNNSKKIDLISLTDRSIQSFDIKNNIFIDESTTTVATPSTANTTKSYRISTKLAKLPNKTNKIEHRSDIFNQQEFTASTATLVSSSFCANSYDSDMFRYQNWIMPEITQTKTKFNNNISNSNNNVNSSASPEFKRFNDLKKTINDIASSNPTTPGTATTTALAKRSQTPDSSYSNHSGGNSSNKENSRNSNSNTKEQIVSILRDPNNNSNSNTITIAAPNSNNSKNLPNKLSAVQQKLNKFNSSIEFNETFQNNNGISNNNSLPVNHRKQQQQQQQQQPPQQQQTMATSETLLITNNQRSSIISENSTLSSQTTTNTSNTTQRLNVNLTTLKSLTKPQLTQSGITRQQQQQQSIGSSSSSNSSNSASNTPNYHSKTISNTINNDTETQLNNNQNTNDDAMSTTQQQVILVKTIHPSNRFANGHLTPINTNEFNNKSSSNIAANSSQMFNSSVSLSSININRSTNNSTLGTPSNNSSSSNNINSSSNNIQRKMNKSVTVGNGINTQTGYLNSLSNNSNSNLSSQFNTLSINNNTANNNNFTASNSNLNASPLKHNSTVPLFQSKKFTEEYRQGMQFDYSDPFQSCSQEFLSRISEMHRLQMDTIEWERKKKLTKKKPKVAATNSNATAVTVAANND